MAGASLQGYATPVRNKESCGKFHSVTCMLTTHKHIVYEVLTYRLRWLSVSFTRQKQILCFNGEGQL